MQKISPADLVPMDLFVGSEPIKIDLVYADANHLRNIFDKTVYHTNARLWAHKNIAGIVIMAARKLNQKYNYTIEIQDCLRTVEAQESLQETDIVKAHPEWMEEPRMLAPPGHGGHPRGMAIDLRLLDENNNEVDMGTLFDDMSERSHRGYDGLSEQVAANRLILETALTQSADALGLELLPLPSEWWDFRFPPAIYNQYQGLRDADLPPQMQMTEHFDNNIPDFGQEHFDKLAQDILYKVNEAF